MSQRELFKPANKIDEALRVYERDGRNITPWVRQVMHAWAARGVRPTKKGVPAWQQALYLELDVLPIPCDCMRCGAAAVIFPPEEGDPNGYCICSVCSQPKAAAAEART